MQKIKIQANASDIRPPVSIIQKQSKTSKRYANPSQDRQNSTAVLPIPNGKSSVARAVDLMAAPKIGYGASGQARMMRAMQETVGNARLSRMLDTTGQTKLTVGASNDIYEQEADQTADQVMQTPTANPVGASADQLSSEEEMGQVQPKLRLQPQSSGSATDPVPAGTEANINAMRGKGRALPESSRHFFETQYNSDFSQVRVHTDSSAAETAQSLNARAFTAGNDIAFGPGQYAPETQAGKKLLAHELTHVVQQGKVGELSRKAIIQRDLAQSLPVTHGVFEVDMRTRNDLVATPPGPKSGLSGTIKFDPATTAPYSNQIKLIQIIRDIDTKTGNPVRIGTVPPGRRPRISTTADPLTGVEGDFHTDVLHHNTTTGVTAPPGSQLPLDYPFGPAGSPGGRQILGYKRSSDPSDIKKAEMFDFPGTHSVANDRDFSFETVAKGEDTMTVYGSLRWDFSIRAGRVTRESMSVQDATSPTFDSAVDIHRDFYVHEPVTFYFGFDQDTLDATETAKIDTFLDYLSRFPDVNLKLEGFADQRGSVDYNLDLANRRTNAVAQALIRKGVDAGRIQLLPPHGETTQFTSDATTDQDREANRRGNRRVTLTFEHTMSFPGP